eukprot:2285986-Pleurochrysis_carterae.AAC.1
MERRKHAFCLVVGLGGRIQTFIFKIGAASQVGCTGKEVNLIWRAVNDNTAGTMELHRSFSAFAQFSGKHARETAPSTQK